MADNFPPKFERSRRQKSIPALAKIPILAWPGVGFFIILLESCLDDACENYSLDFGHLAAGVNDVRSSVYDLYAAC